MCTEIAQFATSKMHTVVNVRFVRLINNLELHTNILTTL